ncbi:LytTR family transcriptional regulator DNA-binding domain-containing protein [Salicibibacter cibi]|uniref:LytTR family transcriptional regulator DNA-binding domain-containing protein n=1 Tax=Salicibibacter cibi TaxID=2743001 RepID=A0A7T7CGQ9_9BACI|nr:LytTR family DNA-binding domain-containing protein [Salicibibacter cibi]QQK81452.1 LytTR family transcriptional regulator DNA-binding domain-containing protein [Salicibibacter cibi]
MDDFSVASMMETFRELFPKETSIAVSDVQHFIYYKPSKHIDLKIRPGDKINENTVTYKALSIQRKTSDHINSKVFGTPYFGTSVPIFDAGRPAGCVTAILPSKQLRLLSSLVTVQMNDRWVPVPYPDVMFFEAQNRKTWIQSERGTGTHKFSLNELEPHLPDDSFIRCHRSYIINVNFITEIQPDTHSTFLLMMKDQTRIPVSQTYASHFRKILSF